MKSLITWGLIILLGLAAVVLLLGGKATPVGRIPTVGEIAGKVRGLIPTIETAKDTAKDTEAAPRPAPIVIPGMGVAKQTLEVTRGGRSQIWDMFEVELGPEGYQFPIWTWVVTFLLVAAIVLPITWWGVGRIADKAGISVKRPDDPKTLAGAAVGIAAIVVGVIEAFRRYGMLGGMGITASGVVELLVCAEGWRMLSGTIREIRDTAEGLFEIQIKDIASLIIDVLSILLMVVGVLLILAGFVFAGLLPIATAASFISPETVTTESLSTLSVSFANTVPKVGGVLRLLITVLGFVSLGYNSLALVVESGLLALGLAMMGSKRRRRGVSHVPITEEQR